MDDKFQEDWQKLMVGFNQFWQTVDNDQFRNNAQHIRQHMETNAVAYNLCTKQQSAGRDRVGGGGALHKPQEELYKKVRELVESHLETTIAHSLPSKTGDALLTTLHKHWLKYNLVAKWVRKVFMYLDQYYTTRPAIDCLTSMCMKCFKKTVFEKIKGNLRDVILQNIEAERGSQIIDRKALRSGIWLFIDMGIGTAEVYNQELELHIIKQSSLYYKKLAQQWDSEVGGKHTYLKRAEDRINEETRRADALFAPTTKPFLLDAIQEQLLQRYAKNRIEDPDSGMIALLSAEKNEDLGRMFRLFKRLQAAHGLDIMMSILQNHIEKEGKHINAKFSSGTPAGAAAGENACTTYIKSCLALHDKYSTLFETHFDNHELFLRARKNAFEVFINPQQSDAWVLKQKTKDGMDVITASDVLSSYIDGVMKKDQDDQLDAIVEKCVVLFTYIHDKDLFQHFYMTQMSRRLMHNKNDQLLEQERALISKLKLKMGSAYTSKLEGMLADQDNAKTLGNKFKDYLDNGGIKLGMDFMAHVLTAGFWPAFKHDKLEPPAEIRNCVEHFTKFHDKAFQQRKLTWIHSLGIVTIFRKFPKGPREMTVTPYQGSVLLLFNDTGSVKVGDAHERLKLPIDDIGRTFHSLAYGKFPVIKRADGNKALRSVKEGDEFTINEEFTSSTRKFKIPAVVKQEREAVVDNNQEQRKHVVEACVVRIMKSRRTLSHNELVTETVKQLSSLFTPEVKSIKRRIEDLIQRQYLERAENDRNCYNYLA
eukprot:TRINITY_DN8342_c0_g1_i1.p1 TRINITY_DN8342_c0_g1~~TRINITY_DN8342_c0_g1_i1.p1  ORF type:complete len:794 (+),score=309.74 TRINITY_DN8342_c0_g1_i1:92-2383(+)